MATRKLYTDGVFDTIEGPLERKYNLPVGGIKAIRTLGERSNSNQVSSKGARTVYQIIPSTREAFKKKYGMDAYASDEAAAEVAALHLRDSMRRNRGDWTAAVAEYNGGTSKARQNNPETRAYVSRVTGKSLVVPAGTNGATQLAPGIDISNLSYNDLKDVAPEDVGSDRPIGPDLSRAPKRSKEQLVTDKLVAGKDLTPDRLDQSPDIRVDAAQAGAAIEQTAEKASYSFADRVSAAVDKNWVLNQLVRGMERDSFQGDPNFHAQYVKNIDTFEAFAQTPEERDRMREATSFSELAWVQQQIEGDRQRDKIINSNDTGTYFEVGSVLVDPAGWLVTAGIGKAAQGLKLASGLARTAAEGAVGNVALTGVLDYSGNSQSASDYAISGVAGLAIGAALHPLTTLRGKPDTSAVDEVFQPMREAADAEARQTLDQAKGELGPDASPEQLVQKVQDIKVGQARSQLEVSLADVGDNNKFLTSEEDLIMTSDPKMRQAQITKSGLDAIDDAGERAMVAEITYRAEQMVKNNPIDEAGLQGRLLKSVGQESTGLTMLRSKSPVMKAMAMQLLEGTTGAGGRRRTAAMSQVTRERLYMRHAIGYEQNFNLWVKAEGKGRIRSMLSQDARQEFDRELYMEINRRGSSASGASSAHPLISKAADDLEWGFTLMANEARHVGTLGAQRLPASSAGYLPRMIDARKIMRLDDAGRREVEGVLAKQFNALNEYSYIDKATKEKVTKTFDPAFSRKLAKGYLVRAMRRGNGSFDVPANIHSSESAQIIEDALEGMAGLSTLEKEAILGKFSRGGPSYTKGRLVLDLDASIGGGKVLGDLFKQDIMGLYRSYARRMSGEVALAQYGIYGKKGLDVMREAAERTGATADELKAFDQIASEFLNTPYKNAIRHAFMDNIRIATSAARLGGMGFTQLGEYTNGLAAVGVQRVLSSVKDMPRLVGEVKALVRGEKVDDSILSSLDTLGGDIGTDGYQMTRMFDLPDADVQLYNDQSVGLAGRILRAGSHMTSVMSGHRILVAVQTRGMAEQIVRKAVGYIKAGKESQALLDMGFTPEIQATIKGNLDKIATFDSRGKLKTLDLMAADIDPSLLMGFRDSVERGAGQIIQRTYTGETGAWAHNDFLKLLFQFRTFSLTSIEKQWGRNQKNYGAVRAFATLMGSMSFAMPIHMARLQAQMVGMDRAEREEFAEKRMSAMSIARASLNYASSAGLLGDAMDVSAGFANNVGWLDDEDAIAFTGGGQGRQTASGIVPGLGMADDVLKGTVGGQFHKIPKLLPGSNLPFVQPLVTAIKPDDE